MGVGTAEVGLAIPYGRACAPSWTLRAGLWLIAVAVHLDNADVMWQPVEQRAGEALGTEGLGPLIEGQTAGKQRGAAFSDHGG